MTKLISTKPIMFRVIAPLALGLILFSGVNGWGQSGETPGEVTQQAVQAQKSADGKKIKELEAELAHRLDSSQAVTADLGKKLSCIPDVNGGKNAVNTAVSGFNNEVTKAQNGATADDATSIKSCQAAVKNASGELNSKLKTMNNTLESQICPELQKYDSKSDFNPTIVGAAKDLSNSSKDFLGSSTDLVASYNEVFPDEKIGPKGFKSPIQSKGTPGLAQPQDPCSTACKIADEPNLGDACNKVAAAYGDLATSMWLVAFNQTAGAHKTWTAVKVGLGLAAVGGVVAIVKGIHHHNDANKRAKVVNAYNNGILTNADGTTTDCTTAQNYLTDACQPVLMHYCTETQHVGGTGCQTFQSSYCALSTSNASYCLAGTATTYCQSYSASSPACQWISTRPASCQANPYDQSCLTSLSNSQLATQCSSYPNDPLCQAFTQGKVVNQAGAADIAANPLNNTTTTTTANPALTAPVGFNQLIDTGSTSSASTSPTDSSTSSSTTGSTTNPGGLTVRAQVRGQPAANMWAANSGTTVAVLCGDSGCH